MFTYRRASDALQLFNGGKEGAARLAKQPALMDLLLDLCRAQAGWPTMTREQALEGLEANRAAHAAAPDDDDEES